MLKTCPLTKTQFVEHYGCQNSACAFKLAGGCAIILAAQTAEDNSVGLHKIAKHLNMPG